MGSPCRGLPYRIALLRRITAILSPVPVGRRVGNDVRVIPMPNAIEVCRCMRNQSRHSMKMSGGMWNGIDMIAVWNIVDMRRRMRDEVATDPRIDRSKGCMRYKRTFRASMQAGKKSLQIRVLAAKRVQLCVRTDNNRFRPDNSKKKRNNRHKASISRHSYRCKRNCRYLT